MPVVTDAYNASPWCFAEVFAAKVVGCPVLPLAAQPGTVHPLLAEDHHVAVHEPSEADGREQLLAYLRAVDLPDTGGVAAWA